MPYKDEKGHFTNKENAGGPCHHDEGGSTSENKQKYTPQSKTEIAVEEYMNKHWDTMDKNKSVGELAYKVSAMVGKPYPQVLDAVTKSIAARQDNPGFDDDYEEEFGEYTGREPGPMKDVDTNDFASTYPDDPRNLYQKAVESGMIHEFDPKIHNFNEEMSSFNKTLEKHGFNPVTEDEFADAVGYNPMKDVAQEGEQDYRSMSISDMDKAGFEGEHNNIINRLRNSGYDSVEQVMKDADKRNLNNKQRAYVEAYANKVFGEEFDEGDYEPEENKSQESFEDRVNKYNRMVGLESQMHSKIDNARKNGQSPQQVLDSVAYDMDLEPGTEEYDRLKNLVMYDTRLNKDTGEYEYNKYNHGSNKQVTGDERKKLQDLSDTFNKAGLENKLEDTWEDYGARMGMTNLIHNNTQVLNPRDWMDYMNGNASADEIIQRVKDSPYKSAYKWKEPKFDQEKHDRFSKSAGKFIESQGSDQDLDEMIENMRKDFSDEEIIKKLAMMFKGTIK